MNRQFNKEVLQQYWNNQSGDTPLRKIILQRSLSTTLSKANLITINDLLNTKPEDIITISGLGVNRYKRIILMQKELRSFIVSQIRKKNAIQKNIVNT